MDTKYEIDWILADGGNGLDVLLFLLLNEPFLQGLIAFALVIILFCMFYDEKDTKWHNDHHG
tara:strand:- start:1599 stop:1784 length:186 start_codon:yes stop_codon:yes gene_type:complete